MNELALFAGAGGGILGGKILGWRTVCAVELDGYAAAVLAQRQNDDVLLPFPIWSDVATFNGLPWRGIVDVVSGGFPCQDISAAGKGAGIEGERSGLWVEMARIIREVRPRFAFVENSPVLTSRGLGRVLGDLAEMGFDARWGVFGAHHAGAPHERDRIWIVAHADAQGLPLGKLLPGIRRQTKWREQREAALLGREMAYADGEGQLQPQGLEPEEWGRLGDGGEEVADAARVLEGRPEQRSERERAGAGGEPSRARGWWESEPDVGRVAHGVGDRVDRLKALGNGQVPAVAALAWRTLTQDWSESGDKT